MRRKGISGLIKLRSKGETEHALRKDIIYGMIEFFSECDVLD